jgi:TolA-binding protein
LGAAKAAEEFQTRFPPSGRLEEAGFWRGEALLRLKRYEAARSAFQKVSAAHPRYAEATLGLGWAYFGEGRWLDAREALRRAASLLAKPTALLGQSLFQEGESSFNLKDYDAAISAYEALLREVPAHPLAEEAAFRLGTFHYKKEDFNKAAVAFTSFLSRPRGPAHDRGYYWLGLSRLRTRQYQLARIAFVRLARDFPESPLREDALLKVGHAYYNEGRFPEAAEAYRSLLSERPREERAREARYGIALTRLRGGDVAGFIQEAREFTAGNPDHPLALTLEFQLAEHFLSHQQYEEARASYAKVLAHRASPELADSAQFRMAEIESLLGRHREAAKFFQELIVRFPESRLRGDARLRLAQALSASGDCRQALEEYRLFLRGFPRHGLVVRALFEAGTCARRLGDDGAAGEFFSALVGQEPSGVLAAQSHWELAEMAKARGELRTALEHMEKALAGGSRELRPRAQFALGEILHSLKEPRRAIVEYLKVAYLYPQEKALSDQALVRVAGIYEELGERGQALRIYQKIEAESGNPALRRMAQERIGALLEGERAPARRETPP